MFAQANKLAILDFENTSGKAEYDALGKAMSSMLITDLCNNIHPKKIEFFERSQLNKLLDEQNLQKSKNFDAKTAVDFGKLSGVNYVFVGSVFVMDGNCNITSKLVDVQTSRVILSKEVNGRIETWLHLKSQLTEAIAQQLNNPVTLDPSYKDPATTLATINQYGKILSTMDQGDAEKAEQMRVLFEETNPEFKYFGDLKDEIEKLKRQVEKNTKDIKVLEKSGGKIINSNTPKEIMNNLTSPNSNYNERKNEVEKLLMYPLDSIQYIYGKQLHLAHFNSYPAGMDGYKLTCSDLDYFISDVEFLLELSKNESINNGSLKYFLECKLDYLRGDVSKTMPEYIVGLKKSGIEYIPKDYSGQFEPLIENCDNEKIKLLNKLVKIAKTYID